MTTPPSPTTPPAAAPLPQALPAAAAAPADAKAGSIFERHKPFLILLAGLTLGMWLWKGKAAALVIGATATALYTVYCKFIDGRGDVSAAAKPKSN